MTMNIPELIFGTIAMSGGIMSVLLFMRTLTSFEKESERYLLILEAWSAVILLSAGYNILFLNIKPWTITMVMISLGALMIAVSFIIYDNQKVDYNLTKA